MEQTPTTGESPRLSTFLRRNRHELLAEWSSRLAAQKIGAELRQGQRLDHMPQVLACIAEAVAQRDAASGKQPFEQLAELHAVDRLDVGFDLAAVIREFATLREVVTERYGPPASLEDQQELALFHRAVDEAIRISAERFARARERTLLALDRVSDAALASDHPETFVRRVLAVLLETAEAADFASVLLLEDERLVTRVAVGMEDEVAGGFSVRVGEGFAGQVAAGQEARELRNAATDPTIRSTYLRRRGVRALYGIPLHEGTRLLGVAQIGSSTSHEFSRDDKLLFREMASRVSAVLAQARLRERERQERERAEEALARVDALLEAVPAGIAFLDPQLRYLLVNETLAGANGQPARAHIGRRVDEVVPEEARRALLPALHRVLDEGVQVRGVPLRARQEGTERALVADLFPVRTASGRLIGVGGLVTDVTERMTAEQRLRESEALMRAVVEGVSDYAIFLIDKRGRVASWNPGVARLKGYGAEEIIGRPTAAFLEGRDEQEAQRQLRIAAETGVFEEEGQRVRKDGSRFWAHVIIRPRLSAEGQVEGFVEVCSDITARRRVAEERERLLAEVDRQKRLLDGVLDDLQIGVAIALPPRGALVYGNRALTRLWGRPLVFSTEVAGYEAYRGFRADGSRLRPGEWPLARALAGHSVEGEEIDFEQPDGSRLTTLQTANPVRDADGNIIAVVATAMDVSERKAAIRELELAAQFRESFLGIVSHDLRSPVSAIALSAELLRGSGRLGDGERRLVERITRSSDRMARMIRDLLDFTRGRLGGGIPIERRPANLERLCRSVVDELESSRPGRTVRLEAAGDLDGEWDADRLSQAIANLTINAIDYSPETEPVRLRVRGDASHVEIEVRNGGEPIPPERIPTLFEPFRRGEEGLRAERSGLGLGLYIVRLIVEAHGGSVAVRSSRKEGTVFTLTLPRRPQHP